MSQIYTKIGTLRDSYSSGEKIELRISIFDMVKKTERRAERKTSIYLSLDTDNARFIVSTKSVNDYDLRKKNLSLPVDSIIATYDLPMDFFKELYSDIYPYSHTDLECGWRYDDFIDVLRVMANNTINLALNFINDPSIKIVGCDQSNWYFRKFIKDCALRILVKLEIRYAESEYA